MSDIPEPAQRLVFVNEVWTCSWCAAPLNESVITHRDGCRWLAEITAAEREQLFTTIRHTIPLSASWRGDALDIIAKVWHDGDLPLADVPERTPLNQLQRDLAEAEFLAASIAVWREIDRLDAEPEGYHPVRMSAELRLAERAAWERYRDLLEDGHG